MDANRSKRNLIALLIAIPIIFATSQLSSWLNIDSIFFWSGVVSSHSNDDEIVRSGDKLSQVVDLSGEWRFASGDDLARADEDFDHSSWSKVDVPAYWESEGYRDYDGYGWYRRQFRAKTKDLNKSLFAILGRIDDVDEVYINGQKVGGLGQFPPTYAGAWNKPREYPIPEGLIREGDNIIAVRVYDAQMDGGIYSGNIGIYASNFPKPLVNLKGEWQFKVDTENSDYHSIQVPGKWEDQGYKDYDGIAWYKKNFTVQAPATEETLMLLLGKVDDTDEVFLNGTLIGRTGNLNASDRNTDSRYHRIKRRYDFSSTLLQENNTLEVRVHDSIGDGGIYEGPVLIMSKSAYLEYHEKQARSGN